VSDGTGTFDRTQIAKCRFRVHETPNNYQAHPISFKASSAFQTLVM
jgi:hypothetical protein